MHRDLKAKYHRATEEILDKEKINKMMKGPVAKSMKTYNAMYIQRDEQRDTRDTVQKQLFSCIKQRQTLETLCTAIFKKNHDLYLQHENMLDEEKKCRADLAKDF